MSRWRMLRRELSRSRKMCSRLMALRTDPRVVWMNDFATVQRRLERGFAPALRERSVTKQNSPSRIFFHLSHHTITAERHTITQQPDYSPISIVIATSRVAPLFLLTWHPSVTIKEAWVGRLKMTKPWCCAFPWVPFLHRSGSLACISTVFRVNGKMCNRHSDFSTQTDHDEKTIIGEHEG